MKNLAPFRIAAVRSQPLRFLVAGGVNALFGYAVYLAGLEVGLRPEVALAVATGVGAGFNYITHGRFVFGHRTFDRLPFFVACYGFLYLVNAALIRALLWAGAAPALAQAALILPMAAMSFVVFRLVVFKATAFR